MGAQSERTIIASDVADVASDQAPGEFTVGDEIEAWYRGTLYRRGRVIEVIASTGLIWILDAATGARTLLDPDASDIVQRNQ